MNVIYYQSFLLELNQNFNVLFLPLIWLRHVSEMTKNICLIINKENSKKNSKERMVIKIVAEHLLNFYSYCATHRK